MLTKIEIDGFKTFSNFELNLKPFTAVVGPNASGKSNLFDALQLLAALAETDVHTAFQDLRGEPEEFFRRTADGQSNTIRIAAELYLKSSGSDDFGRKFAVPSQRLRYEVELQIGYDRSGAPIGIYVTDEFCRSLKRSEDRANYLSPLNPNYGRYSVPFIRKNDSGDALLVRQDGPSKSGNPMQFSLREASRTVLSTISSAEFPHLYAVRQALSAIRFLEINPQAARKPSDRFEKTTLRPDAANLAAVLNRIREQTRRDDRPDGALSDIAADLASLIPSVCGVEVQADDRRDYAFNVRFTTDLTFSSRVISDGTLRLLALLTVLNDPDRRGTLCYEEPENGVHDGRIPTLVEIIREATLVRKGSGQTFQVLLNTHSPKVMEELHDEEIVAADLVTALKPGHTESTSRTRMRTGVTAESDLFEPEKHLSRAEVDRLLQRPGDSG
ncbi:AAA family ATPase [Alteriqipengyuania flavescens]|uniref:AAA family ATPase n=1 Tax=Alteriqipengyuania flavescens TaxID=3053610 RepID=UPI0025B4AA17|nr:AAA family ATPase [Alteriqipengyuania flavescens]WJY18085.1 AAA family ATPase [Alteriqipengyuania flavescens]WJY24026.1 AAA family ATPase [Alteriqipengyuania flavescens]